MTDAQPYEPLSWTLIHQTSVYTRGLQRPQHFRFALALVVRSRFDLATYRGEGACPLLDAVGDGLESSLGALAVVDDLGVALDPGPRLRRDLVAQELLREPERHAAGHDGIDQAQQREPDRPGNKPAHETLPQTHRAVP